MDEEALERRRRSWIRYGLGELDLWFEHLDEKLGSMEVRNEGGLATLIQESEAIFCVCVIINRLAQIDLREAGHLPEDSQLIEWLRRSSGWPKDVAKAFWKGVRNPTMHLGRTFGMASQGIQVKSGSPVLLASVSVVASPWPDEDWILAAAKRGAAGPGWWAQDHGGFGGAGPLAEASRTIHFDLGRVIAVVRTMRHGVESRLVTATSEEIEALAALNHKLPFFPLRDSEARQSPPS